MSQASHKIRYGNRLKLLVAGLAVLLVGISGALALRSSHAATASASIEAETGTISGSASVVSDSAASGAKAVQFAAASTPPSSSTCPAFPAFPDASCTGVPSGYSLTSVANISSSSNGQTIDGKLVSGDIDINHDNVTITNSRIKGHIFLNGHSGIVMKRIDLGPDSCPAQGNGGTRAVSGADGYSLIQSHVHNNGDDLMSIGGGSPVVYQDSIVDQGCYYAGDHLDAVQWYDPGALGSITITHTILNVTPVNFNDKGNAAFFFADGAAKGTRVTLVNNKFGGGQISTSFYDAVKGSGIVIDAHDNVYIKNSYASAPCSFGGSVKSIVYDGTSGVKFSNNKFEDGTAVSCD